MNNTISEGNSEVLKSGYVIAIVFVGFVILVFIIAYIMEWYKSCRDSQFFKKYCSKKHMDKKINNNTTSFIPPIISYV